jgi:Fe-S oxidoreductase
MATKDESATTRGRANVLRLAMSGQLDTEGITSEAAYEALDLCLECRACKAECPVGVDVARFKSEFLAGYYQKHGTPISAKMLGNAAGAAEWGSRFAPIANAFTASPVGRWMNEKLAGVDPRRTLPKWRSDTFASWLASKPRDAGAKSVTLFNDTFTNHYDPEIGIAALEILEHAGYRVNVVRPGCCGRPMISKGLLGDARKQAEQITRELYLMAARGETILFCEPSCLSAVKEDFPSLLRGALREKAQKVAASCQLFDEFAARLELKLNAGPKRILMHGHCHQKSMSLLSATAALLGKIPGAQVMDLDAGCCGMAGSFGYSHYDVSVAIAERKLLPAVRAAQPGDVVVATGTSCRHQMSELANAEAVHPAVLIRKLLAD